MGPKSFRRDSLYLSALDFFHGAQTDFMGQHLHMVLGSFFCLFFVGAGKHFGRDNHFPICFEFLVGPRKM